MASPFRRRLTRHQKGRVAFTASAVDATDLTTYTFASQALGDPNFYRRIAVCITARNAGGSSAVSSVTVAGISATKAVGFLAQGNTNTVEIWVADVPSAVTATVVVTFGGAESRCGIGLFAIYYAGRSTPFATATQINDNTATSLAVPGDGIAIGCAIDVGGSTCTWTNLTEAYDQVVEGTVSHSGACAEFHDGGAKSLTWDWSAASIPSGVYASWGL